MALSITTKCVIQHDDVQHNSLDMLSVTFLIVMLTAVVLKVIIGMATFQSNISISPNASTICQMSICQMTIRPK
jgi:hypothetical protein